MLRAAARSGALQRSGAASAGTARSVALGVVRVPSRAVQIVSIPDTRGSNLEAIRLYRDIVRECRDYNWLDDKGRRWGDVLRESAREEFEQARYERDPEINARLLVVGRDALMQVQERFAHKKHALDQEIAAGHPIGHPEHRQGRVILPNGTPLRADGTVGRR